jgi:hypothetical protein
LEDLGVSGRIILKWILNRMGRLYWICLTETRDNGWLLWTW